jgi:hypothetical protein
MLPSQFPQDQSPKLQELRKLSLLVNVSLTLCRITATAVIVPASFVSPTGKVAGVTVAGQQSGSAAGPAASNPSGSGNGQNISAVAPPTTSSPQADDGGSSPTTTTDAITTHAPLQSSSPPKPQLTISSARSLSTPALLSSLATWLVFTLAFLFF